MMKKYNKLVLTLLCFAFVLLYVNGQPPQNPGGGDPDVGAPLDDGVLFSLVAGLGVGFYKFVFKKKKEQ